MDMTCDSYASCLSAGQSEGAFEVTSLPEYSQSTTHPSAPTPSTALNEQPEDDERLPQSEDGETIQDSDDSASTCIPASASTSPLLSQLGPISPVEELVPAVHIPAATSSPSRRHLDHPAPPASATATGNTPAASTAHTCRLVLDWSRSRTVGAIFQSSSGVNRIHIQAREPRSRHQASIERLKWRVPSSLTYSNSSVVQRTASPPASPASSRPLPESPRRSGVSTKLVHDLDTVSQIPLAGTLLLAATSLI